MNFLLTIRDNINAKKSILDHPLEMRYGNELFPRQGNIIYLDFNPQAGHEQAGRRPALVISNKSLLHPGSIFAAWYPTFQKGL